MPDHPELKWISDAIPQSVRFDDTYYSQDDGHKETQYVFVDGNGLPERFGKSATFSIGELGFGTGLNFFETVRQFQIANPSGDQNLLFYSFEKYPLGADQMKRALSQWPDVAAIATSWLEDWRPEPGVNLLRQGNISLAVAIGDAQDLLLSSEEKVDAWYLDGFNPKNNGAMWTPELISGVFERTNAGGTFATYTAAGWVRRNLEAAGFSVQRRKGYGNKREMLLGRRELI
ncbi:MAG: tRNA (5-methylaminomethyl-2-thiouridine)(34)-methyltransferase MnmD [Stappiaceae bacterium]